MKNADLLRRVQELAFAMDEAELFLDTHPQNAAALDYFQRRRDEWERAVEAYEGTVGPLTSNAVQGDRWTWIDGPWPWQRPHDMNDMSGGSDCRGGMRGD